MVPCCGHSPYMKGDTIQRELPGRFVLTLHSPGTSKGLNAMDGLTAASYFGLLSYQLLFNHMHHVLYCVQMIMVTLL